MCGVWGKFGDEVQGSDIPQAVLRLAHRGPDGYGHYFASNAALVHTRLAIIGLSTGAQPIRSSCEQWIGVVNGEIYNYKILKARLQLQGCVFRTESDSEVLINAFAKWGVSGLSELKGEFAFILWNPSERRCVFGRDLHGVKPLYIRKSPSGIELGSEIKAIRPASCPIDYETWASQMLRMITPLKTLFQGIEHVAPGRLWSWDAKENQLSSKSFAALPLGQDRRLRGAAAEEELRFSFDQAVSRRLVSDVDVGCYLSGGLDSALVAATMQRLGARPKAFTVGFGAGPFDESQKAAAIAKSLGLEHHVVELNDSNFVESLEKSFLAFEMPTGNAHGAAKNCLAEYASNHVRVVLSGEGADEYFGGYAYLRIQKLKAFLDRHPQANHDSLIDTFRKRELGIAEGYLDGLDEAWAPATKPYFQDLFPASFRRLVPPRLVRFLMGREFRGFERAIQLHQAYLKDELPAVSSQVDLDTWVALRGDLLSYILANLGDRQEMSHGLEGRTPFLDSDLAQLACRLHPSELIFGLREKHALRKLLPPELKQVGRKHPFFAPPRLLQAPKAQDFLLDHCQSLRGWIPEFDFGRFDVLVREMQADPARQKILGEMRLYLASTHIILSQLDQLSPAARVFGEVPAPKDGEIYFSPVFRSLPVAQRGIA